jgi:hypothetical protein
VFFFVALKRIDELQGESDKIRQDVATTQGQVQVNRENIGEIAELVRQSGVKLSTASDKGGTKAELALINEDLTAVRQGRALLVVSLCVGFFWFFANRKLLFFIGFLLPFSPVFVAGHCLCLTIVLVCVMLGAVESGAGHYPHRAGAGRATGGHDCRVWRSDRRD